MKILTLTTYNVYNYGAALQAYALQTYLMYGTRCGANKLPTGISDTKV